MGMEGVSSDHPHPPFSSHKIQDSKTRSGKSDSDKKKKKKKDKPSKKRLEKSKKFIQKKKSEIDNKAMIEKSTHVNTITTSIKKFYKI